MTETPNPSGHAPPVALSVETVREIVFGSNRVTQDRFNAEFPDLIERTIRAIAAAHRQLDLYRATAAGDLRAATLELFFHSAVNAVVCSTHHLVSGFPIAAGNLMRHYTESVAMALLCIEPSLGIVKAFNTDRLRYPIRKAPDKLRQKRVRTVLKDRIGFDGDAWETVLQISGLYDKLSHASALSLGHQLLLDTDHGMIIGSEYDPAKRDPYRSDLLCRATAAESLAHLIRVVTGILPKRGQGDPHTEQLTTLGTT